MKKVRRITIVTPFYPPDHIPVKAGIRQAWKISMLISSWGHPSAENWRNNKAFITYQTIILKWLSELFGRVVFENEPLIGGQELGAPKVINQLDF